jgi:cyclopropane fatty-acyl-phospholipid synthase-like methyltransferase
VNGPVDHFEALYQQSPDPWNVGASWYERRKRALLLASLPQERYTHAFEPGCGTGEMTLALADRCDQVCAVDFSATAVHATRQRMTQQGLKQVQLHTLALPQQWPVPLVPSQPTFDLILISELAYYLDSETLDLFLTRCVASLKPSGDLVLCHWRHAFHDRRQTTDAVHAQADRYDSLQPLLRHTEDDFRLDIRRATSQGSFE